MSVKYVCIHGHFYQPPRENAWLETIEVQESARPYHDWNERINFECYAPNRAARILDTSDRITRIVNNYERISFNFGPTLLQWLEKSDPETYAALLEADRRGAVKFGGHGPAIAQVYGHLIMPLANHRDKVTQVRWGIQDFQHRFGRAPEGMWLAETAVDTNTLEVLAEEGVAYTVLAPRQAAAVRKVGTSEWVEVDEGSLLKDRAYRCVLPSGASIALFFYDGAISRGVAFEGLLNDGAAFAERLVGALDSSAPDMPQLMHIATDGESYGHHHRFGEMALANCLTTLEDRSDVQLTVYGQYLEKYPPEEEVKIWEASSWSCEHGVERWRSDCGCNTGRGYHQQWRAPLRAALDWLRDELAIVFEQQCSQLLVDPWKARNEYIEVILDRSEKTQKRYLANHAVRQLKEAEATKVFRLMEMQRQAMQMYTSCGWFFDEISGIETLQILQYAIRAIQLADLVSDKKLLPEFLQRLEQAPSNVMQHGAEVVVRKVLPGQVDLERMGMHLAAAALFEDSPEHLDLFTYKARILSMARLSSGQFRLATGRIEMQNTITLAKNTFSFAVLHLGQHHLTGRISQALPESQYQEAERAVTSAFQLSDIEQTLRMMEHFFTGDRFSFEHLFADEKTRILSMLARESISRAEKALIDMYTNTEPLMATMHRDRLPIPRVFRDALGVVLNRKLESVLKKREVSSSQLDSVISKMIHWEVAVSDTAAIQLLAGQVIFRQLTILDQEGYPDVKTRNLILCIQLIQSVYANFDPWQAQNRMVALLEEIGKKQSAGTKHSAVVSELASTLRITLPD